MLPVEITTRYLERVTKLIVEALLKRDITAKEPEMLNAITKPFTNLIIQLDKNVLEQTANGNTTDDVRLLRHNFQITNINSTFLSNSTRQYGKCKKKKEKKKKNSLIINNLN
jgi:hypothetical protein